MKLKKYLCLGAVVMLLLTGCGSSEPLGKIEKLTVLTLQEKMANEESFAVVLTQESCTHCKTFLKEMTTYMKSHNMVLYDVVLDLEPNFKQSLKELETIFPKFTGTPDVYYIENGVVKSRIHDELESGEGLDAKSFHKWTTKYGMLNEE